MSEHHLILGGGGFIGKHVALLLARAGHQVTLAGRRPLAHAMPEALADRVTFRRLELGSADWDSLVATADVVHHYAWGSIPASANANPGGDLRTNVGLTIDMLDALQRRGAGGPDAWCSRHRAARSRRFAPQPGVLNLELRRGSLSVGRGASTRR